VVALPRPWEAGSAGGDGAIRGAEEEESSGDEAYAREEEASCVARMRKKLHEEEAIKGAGVTHCPYRLMSHAIGGP
jgi:hypothetical protein